MRPQHKITDSHLGRSFDLPFFYLVNLQDYVYDIVVV
jgi:hypothetical protein